MAREARRRESYTLVRPEPFRPPALAGGRAGGRPGWRAAGLAGGQRNLDRRPRVSSPVRKSSLAVPVALVSLALVAASCGGGGSKQAHHATTTATTTAPPASTSAPGAQATSTTSTKRRGSTSTSSSTSSTTSATSTTSAGRAVTTTTTSVPKGPPVGGPVPAGFSPVSFTAVSSSEFWLLGSAPCSNPVCTSIVRTTDGGSHFVGIPAPPAPLGSSGAGPSGAGSSGGGGYVTTLRFADPLDGYAYGTGLGGSLWETHNGGATWDQASFLSGRALMGFGTGAGYAFALVGSCAEGSCSQVVLDRSPVGSDNWAQESVPLPAGVDPLVAMAVKGDDLWFSVTTSPSTANQLLLAGTGFGAHFATYTSPCYSGLGGTIEASSASVLWSVCPTGMLAGAERSTDGGARWSPLPVGELANSAILAPASDTTAVLQPGSQGELLRTTDGGTTWQRASSPQGGSFVWLGFSGPLIGAGLFSTGASDQLWLTSDGGATWTGPVKI
jgi:hypothetical protein